MSNQVIQFQCNACHATLTVPAHLAGVTGPCPHCGNQITSPAATAPAAPSFQMPAPQPPAPAAQPLPGQIPSHVHIPTPPSPGIPMPEQPAPQAWGQPQISPIPGLPGMPSGNPSGAAYFPSQPAPAPQYQPQQPPQPQPQAQQQQPEFPGAGGISLPPRRSAAQGNPSNQGSLLGGLASSPIPAGPNPGIPAPQGASIPPPRGQQPGMPSHLIPGAPTLGEPIGNAPIYPQQSQQPGFSNDSFLGSTAPSTDPLAAINAARDPQVNRPRPQFNNRPRRSSSVFMFLVASLLLVGFLGAVGYIFRKPLMDVYASVVKKETPAVEAPALPSPTAAPVATSTQAPSPTVPPAPRDEPPAPRPATTGFDPTETVLRASSIPKPMVVEDGTEPTPTVKPPGPDGLVEVPAPAVPTPTAPTQAPEVATGGSSAPVEINVPPEGEPALKALKQFLFARDLNERRPHILGADDPEMLTLVDRYYKVNSPGPIDTANIMFMRIDENPETASAPHCVFQVSTKDLPYPIPVMLQGSPDGYKVDWISFIEFKDELLFKFLSKFQEVPGSFHVGISRSHYFEEDVPDRESKDCFRLQPPSAPYEGYVFVPKDSPLSADLRNKISWETETSFVIVELQWRKLGTFQWVEMTGMPQLNWYSLPSK